MNFKSSVVCVCMISLLLIQFTGSLQFKINLRQQNINARKLNQLISVFGLTSLLGGSPVLGSDIPKLGECLTDTNPQATTIFCRQLGLVDGRLRGCQSIENCISTSAKSAQKYSPPWRYGFDGKIDNSIDSAWIILQNAITAEGLKILKVDENTHYILAAEKNVPKQPSGSSLFYEFLFKDSAEEKLVLYRGVVDKTVLLYPLQQPVSDFGALSQRLDKILARTGWLKVGE